ncbi:MAG: hypothetical protein CM15mP70_16790 [Pelagibacteraceae bacterium]|nr:MAG: hypothetical protein CM15mP70_16790 [Pelagibacteraceae bacterium]
MSDIEIARAASKIHIRDVAAKIDIPEESLVPYGHDIAKINFDFIEKSKSNPDGKLILVTQLALLQLAKVKQLHLLALMTA